MKDPRYIDNAPDSSQRITVLHVWVSILEDGSEGIVSADLPFETVTRHMPLLSSRYTTAVALRPLAENIRDEALHQAGRVMRVALRTFTLLAEG